MVRVPGRIGYSYLQVSWYGYLEELGTAICRYRGTATWKLLGTTIWKLWGNNYMVFIIGVLILVQLPGATVVHIYGE